MTDITVKNKLFTSLQVPIEGKKPITIGPRGSAKISEEDLKSDECQRLLATRQLIRLPEAGSTAKKKPSTSRRR